VVLTTHWNGTGISNEVYESRYDDIAKETKYTTIRLDDNASESSVVDRLYPDQTRNSVD
jgi:hypothetical protein